MKVTAAEIVRLKEALQEISEVQVAIALREEKVPRKERPKYWQSLYQIRIDLAGAIRFLERLQ
jgi:hypothetical protein